MGVRFAYYCFEGSLCSFTTFGTKTVGLGMTDLSWTASANESPTNQTVRCKSLKGPEVAGSSPARGANHFPLSRTSSYGPENE